MLLNSTVSFNWKWKAQWGDTMTDQKTIQNNIEFRSSMEFEPGWLYEMRKNSWEHYRESAFPARVNHLWRYSDPAGFDVHDPVNQLLELPISTNGHAKDMKPLSDDYSAAGYIRSDRVAIGQIHKKYRNSGMIVSSLYDAALQHSDLIEKHLGTLVDEQFGKFEAANMALWNSGIFVYVPSNLEIDEPVYLHRHPTGNITFSRLLVIVGENSKVTFIDNAGCHCVKEQAYVNNVREMIVGDSSTVTMVELQDLPEGYSVYNTIRNRLHRNANLKTVSFSLGADQSKINTGTMLSETGSETRWYGMLFGNKRQKYDHHTIHEHESGNTYSDLVFKVALQDHSESAYTGMIRINESAKNCEAYQENRNLLLSDASKAESIPELEISNDDVRCSHGVTVGKIDSEMLFYLESRGIEASVARQMIVNGFFGAILEQVPDTLKNTVSEIVSKRMGEVGNGQLIS